MKKLLVTWAFLMLPALASSGGSWEKVSIESLTLFNNTDYELVVVPKRQSSESSDPYMGHCSRFTVKGTYSWLHSWRFPDFVNRENHKAALTYIQQEKNANKAILFGWMGTGFVTIDPDSKCVVRSRAWQLFMEGEVNSVISYHNAV